MLKFLRVSVVVLLLILCLGALYGSWSFISDPSGNKFFLSVELLNRSPFKSYLIPGIILLIVNGIFPVFVMVSLLKRKIYFKWLLILLGCLLTGWLSIQLLISKEFFNPMMHYSCYAIALLLIYLGYLFIKLDKGIRWSHPAGRQVSK